ncbi:MAG: ANTAR domain-containing protein [Candidatus Andersenbacteria bacterium]
MSASDLTTLSADPASPLIRALQQEIAKLWQEVRQLKQAQANVAQDCKNVNQENEKLRQRIADRPFVEQAKSLLMKFGKMDESCAYNTLRNNACSRNMTIGAIARAVIITFEIFHDADVPVPS